MADSRQSDRIFVGQAHFGAPDCGRFQEAMRTFYGWEVTVEWRIARPLFRAVCSENR